MYIYIYITTWRYAAGGRISSSCLCSVERTPRANDSDLLPPAVVVVFAGKHAIACKLSYLIAEPTYMYIHLLRTCIQLNPSNQFAQKSHQAWE